METLLAAIESADLVAALRRSRWVYPLVNAAHILGLGLLVGAIASLDLRLMGLWRDTPREMLLRIQRPVAATGLALAASTGMLLFAVKARDYAATPLFQVKMALLALALANIALHSGARLRNAGPRRSFLAGAMSLALWIAILVCGRMLGYL